ncbi:MAG: hypothetical protein E6K80_08935 [Candidatus Eisenbacteria bacterium]|uniref:Uncharacterized protein n=1 Tax=Eiseniibacteriota bacterium TaxID=2212470 RepID=A0A538U329_UNCEI|nr:MAG: hypothetical protein E6K80_08935 [Candidatus Eisenbacteria bacterium]
MGPRSDQSASSGITRSSASAAATSTGTRPAKAAPGTCRAISYTRRPSGSEWRSATQGRWPSTRRWTSCACPEGDSESRETAASDTPSGLSTSR